MNFKIVCVIAAIIGILRFVVPVEGVVAKEDIFKDIAHLFVGGVFGAWLATWQKHYLYLGIALSVLEVIAFFVRQS